MRLVSLSRLVPLLAPLAIPLAGCATLHHVQLDEIDASRGRLEPFEIHVSELGIDVRQAGHVASAVSGSKAPNKVAALVSLFQFGPKTGEPGLDDRYADVVAQAILERCPGGRVTGLVSVRESTKYYAVSAEYVSVRGFCIVD